MIERNIDIGLGRQCELLRIHRSGLYYAPLPESEDNLKYMRLFDEQYLKTPFYGIRRMTRWLNKKGFKVNRKRVIRLMSKMGWQTLYRKPNTSWKNKENKIYPYLLKDIKIDHRNQVWGIDIMEYTEMLLSKGIKISMDGKGRAIDNIFIERLWKSVKYECIYLHAFEDGVQLYEGLDNYFTFYNTERLHQSLDYETPESLYKKAA